MTINYYSYEELKAAVIANASESELLVVYWYLVSE